VLVIGGGPAGMEAARVASLRGHNVTLYEKGEALGGQLIAASTPQFKQPIKELVEYLKTQIKKQGVKVKIGQKATTSLIKKMKPDVLIAATGATHIIPDIPGVERDHVATACDVLLERKKTGDKVVIIGGGQLGCELAWYLAEKGKKMTIVEMLGNLADDVNMFSRFYLMDKLAELGVNMLTNTTAQEIADKSVVALDMEGKKQVIEADTVVLATGFKPNTQLEKKLKGIATEIYVIGDCVKPGKIWDAISSGSRVARQI
jgi:2-enoate reductase